MFIVVNCPYPIVRGLLVRFRLFIGGKVAQPPVLCALLCHGQILLRYPRVYIVRASSYEYEDDVVVIFPFPVVF